jgi:hypothetical protein
MAIFRHRRLCTQCQRVVFERFTRISIQGRSNTSRTHWHLDCSPGSGRRFQHWRWDIAVVTQRRKRGPRDGRQLHVSLWSDVVQVRAARGRQGIAKGCEFRRCGRERTGLGDVGKRCASLEGYGQAGATQSSQGRRGQPVRMTSRYFYLCKTREGGTCPFLFETLAKQASAFLPGACDTRVRL